MQTNELLKALGGLSGTRARTGQTAPGETAVSGSFEELLEQARGGAITTDATVKIAKGLDIKLTPDQLRRARPWWPLSRHSWSGDSGELFLLLLPGLA